MTKLPTDKLIRALDNDLTDYQSIPFWSWNNELEPEELVRQIEDMKAVGIGGFIMHARIGLKDEYLGEKWFSCIDACLKKARELGMRTMREDGIRKISSGLTTPDEVLKVTMNEAD